jgi:hypothetical protein
VKRNDFRTTQDKNDENLSPCKVSDGGCNDTEKNKQYEEYDEYDQYNKYDHYNDFDKMEDEEPHHKNTKCKRQKNRKPHKVEHVVKKVEHYGGIKKEENTNEENKGNGEEEELVITSVRKNESFVNEFFTGSQELSEDCIICEYFIKHSEKYIPINSEIIKRIDVIMRKGIRLDKTAAFAVKAKKEYDSAIKPLQGEQDLIDVDDHFIDSDELDDEEDIILEETSYDYNNIQVEENVTSYPSIEEIDFETHYKKNHTGCQVISMYQELNASKKLRSELMQRNLYYTENSGPFRIDPITRTKKRTIVEKLNPKTYQLVMKSLFDTITMRMRIMKERKNLGDKQHIGHLFATNNNGTTTGISKNTTVRRGRIKR